MQDLVGSNLGLIVAPKRDNIVDPEWALVSGI